MKSLNATATRVKDGSVSGLFPGFVESSLY